MSRQTQIDEESLQLQLDLIHFQAELDAYLDACREFKERDSTFHFKDPDFLPNEYALFQDPERNSHRALAWKRWKEFAEMERTPVPPELATEVNRFLFLILRCSVISLDAPQCWFFHKKISVLFPILILFILTLMYSDSVVMEKTKEKR